MCVHHKGRFFTQAPHHRVGFLSTGVAFTTPQALWPDVYREEVLGGRGVIQTVHDGLVETYLVSLHCRGRVRCFDDAPLLSVSPTAPAHALFDATPVASLSAVPLARTLLR